MGMVGVGSLVQSKVAGRFAEKKEDGSLTGKMISVSENDVGTVIRVMKPFRGKASYLVRFMGSDVTLIASHFRQLGSHEDVVPRDVMDKIDVNNEVKRDDCFEDAEY
jgi:hypothetical protein